MNQPEPSPNRPRLVEQIRQTARLRHLSYRTEQSYLHYIRQFILFHHKRHPQDMGVDEIRTYLSSLAIEKNVAASTQNVARCALIFLYQQVLRISLPEIDAIEIAKRPARLPVVFSKQEVQEILSYMAGTQHLMASLLYGSGLRLMECIRLRVKDIDFDYQQITVRDGKGRKDRVTMLPKPTIAPIKFQIKRVEQLHQRDLAQGYGAVYLPDALAKKYPRANQELLWQYIFPAENCSVDPRSGIVRRHHIGPQSLQRAMKQAIHRAG